MKYRKVKISLPSNNLVKTSEINIENNNDSIYQTINLLKKRANDLILKEEEIKLTKISEIINLHNSDGIKELSQINSMISTINSGKHVLDNNLPNIKIVNSNNNLILFDGHHSTLAYMSCKKIYLHEIPHIIVDENDENELLIFYGEHSKEIKNWHHHVINWQQPKQKQLQLRIQKNMGELFDKLNHSMLIFK